MSKTELLDVDLEDRPSREQIEAYLASQKNRLSKSSLISLKSRLFLVRRLFNGLSSEITPDELYNRLLETGLSAYSRKTTMILYAGFEEAVYYTKHTKNFLKRNSFLFRHAYKEKTKKLLMSQIAEALRETKDVPDIYNFIVLCGLAGLRNHEARKVEWKDLDTTSQLLTVVGKGNKQRQVPLDTTILKPTDGPRPVMRNYTNFIHRNWPKSLAGFTPHDLRSTYITHLVNTPGVGIKDVSQAVGHSNIATTSRYIRADVTKLINPMKEAIKL